MARPDLIAVGDVMLDIVVADEALARGGHVRGMVRVRAGGSALNAALAARAAGASAGVVGRVGADAAGAAVQAVCAEHGVEPLLAVDEGLPTGVVLTLGDRVVAERGANARFAPADVPDRLAGGAVLVSGYVLLHADTGEAARAALDRAATEWLAVDAASAQLLDHYGRERFLAATGAASVLLLNEEEAAVLTGEAPDAAVRALADRYRVVCVKRGAAGAVAALDGDIAAGGAPTVDVADASGAGDAFAGAFLSSLAARRDLRQALEAGCRAGARAARSAESWLSLNPGR